MQYANRRAEPALEHAGEQPAKQQPTLSALVAQNSNARARIAAEILLRDEQRFMQLVRLGEDQNDRVLDRVHMELYSPMRTLQIRLGLAVGS